MPYSSGAESQTLLHGQSPYELPPVVGPLRELPAERGKPAPRGFHLERGPHPVLVASGASLFGFSYLLAVVLARAEPSALATPQQLQANPALDRPLYAPVVGPILALAQGERSVGSHVLVASVGLGQLAGLGLLAAGLAMPQSHLVEDGPAVALTLAPGFLGLRGAF